MLLEEDIAEEEMRAARASEIRMRERYNVLADVGNAIKAEAEQRQMADNAVLDTLLATQAQLQLTILEHFGNESKRTDRLTDPR
jgi:hypothetical protein